MKFNPRSPTRPRGRPGRREQAQAGFTLAEVLAALLFMAIVIPVAMQGLQVASRAGVVAVRKAEAARVADRLLNESIVTTNWNQSMQSGVVIEDDRSYRWSLRSEQWNQALTNQTLTSSMGVAVASQPTIDQSTANQVTMNLLTVEVTYVVQSQEFSVRESTLVNPQTAQ
jgi:type II secretory pathway pseudopilin PulG